MLVLRLDGSIDPDARYRAPGYSALYVVRYDQMSVDNSLSCDSELHDDDEDGAYTSDDMVWSCGCAQWAETVDNLDMVICIMVGDDRENYIDVSELTLISDDDYCGSCGQIGCGHE